MLKDIRYSLRLLGILRRLGRHGALFFLSDLPLSAAQKFLIHLIAGPARRETQAKRPGERLCLALQQLGPSFIKLGQALSCRPDLIGERVAVDLGKLRDRLPPVSAAAAIAAIEADLGRPMGELFATFDDIPVAAASIAQVHFATTPDGIEVAVKTLRPGIEAAFARDLELFAWAADRLEIRFPAVRRLRPIEIVRTLAASVAAEMDLRLEAAAAAELADNFVDQPLLRVPSIHWQLTGKRTLTMARIDGISIADLAALNLAWHDLSVLATRIIQLFLTQVLAHGFFHADQHPGNLFVAPDGAIIAVDFGIMGRLDRQTRLFFADMLHAFLIGDWRRAAEVHFAAGYVSSDYSVEAFAQACRAIGQPILDRPVQDISLAKLLAQLFQVTAMFGMQTQLLLLQKTMVTVEGVASHLDPNINFWTAARPVVEPWAAQNLSPEARLRDTVGTGLKALRALPELINRLIDRPERIEFPPVVATGASNWVARLAFLMAVIALLVALIHSG